MQPTAVCNAAVNLKFEIADVKRMDTKYKIFIYTKSTLIENNYGTLYTRHTAILASFYLNINMDLHANYSL